MDKIINIPKINLNRSKNDSNLTHVTFNKFNNSILNIPKDIISFSGNNNLNSLEERWFKLSNKFEIPENVSKETFNILINNYSESTRAYHTIEHVQDCLDKLDNYINDSSTPKPKNLEILELAIIFHDIINGCPNDVEDSAKLAVEFLSKSNSNKYNNNKTINLLKNIILATKHDGTGIKSSLEVQLMLDIDLSILGESPEKYKKYSKNVRQEYLQYDDQTYKIKRSKVLERFLNQDTLFLTLYFKNKYQKQARNNLLAELQDLR